MRAGLHRALATKCFNQQLGAVPVGLDAVLSMAAARDVITAHTASIWEHASAARTDSSASMRLDVVQSMPTARRLDDLIGGEHNCACRRRAHRARPNSHKQSAHPALRRHCPQRAQHRLHESAVHC